MNKLTIALIIAQNGLKTAGAALTANATKLEGQASSATDPAQAAKLTKKASKQRKLAQALNAADAGISTYLADPDAA